MAPADTPAAVRVRARAPRPRHASRLRHKLARDSGVLALPDGPAQAEPVSARQLAGLPGAAQQYLRFMGVPGRAADWSFLAHCTGRFRLRPGWPWLPCEAWQYNSGLDVARVFHLRIGGPVPMSARDAYEQGQGSVRGTLLGVVPLVNATGPEYDVSELVTYLNDAVFCAPGMLLNLPVTWSAAGDRCFDLTLRDAGHRVTARVFLDERGAPIDFSTEDRWCDLPGGLARVRWTTPVQGCRQRSGRWLPTQGTAIWHLPGGDFSYAELRFRPGDLSYNVAGASRHGNQPGTASAAVTGARPGAVGDGMDSGPPAG
jgi:hypothetical protein